jgi:hypothetical protein
MCGHFVSFFACFVVAKHFLFSCFNCDLILIEHRNKHIVTFFGQLAHTNFLTSDRHLGCKVVQAFLNLTLEKLQNKQKN